MAEYTNNTFGTLGKAQIFLKVRTLQNYGEMREVLAEAAQKKGMTFSKSVELADQVMAGVMTFEDFKEALESDTEEAVGELFGAFEDMEPQERLAAVDRILFGLQCAADEKLYTRLEEGEDGEELYAEVRTEAPAWSEEKEEELRKELVRRLEHLNLSSSLLRKKLEDFTDPEEAVATASALGREGYELKCVAAMQHYLNAGDEADLAESVAAACTGIEMQAVADAVEKGYKAEDAAKIVLNTLIAASVATAGVIAAWTVLFASAVTHPIIVTLIGAGAAALITKDVVEIMEPLTEKASMAAGSAGIVLAELLKKGTDTINRGLARARAYMETERKNLKEQVPDLDEEQEDLNWEDASEEAEKESSPEENSSGENSSEEKENSSAEKENRSEEKENSAGEKDNVTPGESDNSSEGASEDKDEDVDFPEDLEPAPAF